jgi:uncharacterized membrane protein
LIEHLQNHPLGLIHVLTALAALIFGAAVIFSRKGTQKHRWIGRGYLISMVSMSGTALAIFELSGQFGLFHWLALMSSVSVLAGYQPTWHKTPKWRYPHAYFMVGSYIGLTAGAAAEVVSRVPNWSFWPSVIISSVVVIVVGTLMMWKLVPRSFRSLVVPMDNTDVVV